MPELSTIFDRKIVARHRDRAAPHFAAYDFLVREASERLMESLESWTRPFPVVLDLGCHQGQLAPLLRARGGITSLIQSDMSLKMLSYAQGTRIVADEETLPFAEASIDLVVSALSLHWVNDVPGMLIQLRRTLKPQGVMILSLLGGNTLTELRQAIMAAEIAFGEGSSPHISPFIDSRDAGALLQRAGFSMPVATSETLTVTYENALKLMHDLRGMGESNALMAKSGKPLSRRMIGMMCEEYRRLFPASDGGIRASFEIVTMMGMRL